MRLSSEQSSPVDIRILTDIHKFDRACLAAPEYGINHAGYAAVVRGVAGECAGIGKVVAQYRFLHDRTIL